MINIDAVDFEKMDGLVPAIVQDAGTRQVLMLGFMNREALERTLNDRLVTFWSRSRKTLWQKGETSGNRLDVISIAVDCDRDTLLVTARASGPVCHNGTFTCFDEERAPEYGVLHALQETIARRRSEMPEGSYTTSLFQNGRRSIAQKVGEEGVEVALASIAESTERVTEEAADLLYHLVVLLTDCDLGMQDVMEVLKGRMK